MRIVDIIETFTHAGKEFKKDHRLVMAEDIESQYRSLYKEKIGMSYPFETVYKPYKGEDLTGKKIMVFRTGGIGDIFFINPVFRHLKTNIKIVSSELHLDVNSL